MASSFTTNKSIEKPAYNDYASNPTGWSVPVNNDWDIIDKAFGGVQAKSTTGGTTNLTVSEAQNLVLIISGTLTSNATFTLPLNSGSTGIVGGQWVVRNATTGNFTVTIAPVSGGGSSVVIPQGTVDTIYSDGTNITTSKTVRDPFPVGGIIMWSGSIATIPSGWFLCNGSNGTPDLRDRFIIGASQDNSGVASTNVTGSLTQTGGSKDAIVVSHTHTATVTDPGHGHPARYANSASGATNNFGGIALSAENPVNYPAYTGSLGNTIGQQITANTTGITVTNSSTGSSGTNANLPPYYALAYIMRGAY